MNDIKVKVNKLDIYHKDWNRLDKSLIILNIYLTFNIVLPRKKTLFISNYFRNHTKKSLKLNLKKYLSENKKLEEIFS